MQFTNNIKCIMLLMTQVELRARVHGSKKRGTDSGQLILEEEFIVNTLNSL